MSRGRARPRSGCSNPPPPSATASSRSRPRRPPTRADVAVADTAQLRELTAAAAISAIGAGDLDTDELFAAYADRVDDDELNAYLCRCEGGSGDPGSPLAGVPVAVKDIFCTEGIPTTAASRILEGYIPPYTSTAVAQMTRAGARVLGKTNMDEFAMGSSNENSAFGPVLNPWDPGRVPGGSSGGSAAAVAGGLAPWALGTDTGGSIRQPAALCGIVGLKPTYGAISRYGMIAFASSLDQCGPLTRDITDAALMLGRLQGADACDSTCVGIDGGVEMPSRQDLEGLRFGVVRELSGEAEGIESGVQQVFEQTLQRITALGGEVAETTMPNTRRGLSAYYVIAPAEASANLARFDGVRYGHRADAADLTASYERTRAEGFGPEVKRRIMLGTYALSSGYYDAYYRSAQQVRTRIVEDFDRAFGDFDFIVTPTSPTVSFGLGAKTDDPLAMYLNDYCTVPMSLAGIPALSLPAGLAEPDGGGPPLPVGVQLAGPAFSETRLLDAAYALEQAIGFDALPPARAAQAR
ncbi:MAG: Asp-tRNA(Asn)/Glu-tRNA(Gln) amidotransferase subunit GatA [Solirubrobacterales bacterium]